MTSKWISGLMRIAVALTAAAAVTACGVTSKAENKKAEVRFVNLLSNAGKVSVDLGGTMVATDLAVGTFSGATEHNSGYYETKLKDATGAVLATYNLGLSQARTTVFLTYPASGTTPVQVSAAESTAPVTVASGKFVARTLLLGSRISAVDLYVTAPAADISALSPNSYGAGTGTFSLRTAETDAGTYQVRLTTAGTKNVVYSATQTFASGSDNVIVLNTAGSATVPTVMVYREGEGSIAAQANSLARLRLVNGLSGITLKGDANGATVLAATEYAKAGAYATVASGTLPLKLVDSSTSALQSEGDIALATGRDYTLVATGSAGNVVRTVFEEDAREGSTTAANVRFANVSAAASVDVVEDTTVVASAVGKDQRSVAKDATQAAHTYDFRQTGTTASLAKLTSEILLAGGNYSFVLIGGGTLPYAIIAYRSN